MKRTSGFSLLVLAAFSTFLVLFIGALCVKHIEKNGRSCEPGAVSVAAANSAPNPARALELVRLAYADRPVCPPRVGMR
jgi:hypothetical protein